MNEKKEIRKKLKLKRAAAFCAHKNHAQDLIANFPFAIEKNLIIAGFIPFGDEINILPLLKFLENNGAQLCLPRINYEMNEINFHSYQSDDFLEISKFGIKEPAAIKNILIPNWVLVPLLGYDKFGFRIGYGGGYYDRAIKKLRETKNCKFIGIAFKEQEIDKIPIENHDERLDYILNPDGLQILLNPQNGHDN